MTRYCICGGFAVAYCISFVPNVFSHFPCCCFVVSMGGRAFMCYIQLSKSQKPLWVSCGLCWLTFIREFPGIVVRVMIMVLINAAARGRLSANAQNLLGGLNAFRRAKKHLLIVQSTIILVCVIAAYMTDHSRVCRNMLLLGMACGCIGNHVYCLGGNFILPCYQTLPSVYLEKRWRHHGCSMDCRLVGGLYVAMPIINIYKNVYKILFEILVNI